MSNYGEVTEELFNSGLLNNYWKKIAKDYKLYPREKEVLYLYFGIGMDQGETCQTLEISNEIFVNILKGITFKFDFEFLNVEDSCTKLRDKIRFLLGQYQNQKYLRQPVSDSGKKKSKNRRSKIQASIAKNTSLPSARLLKPDKNINKIPSSATFFVTKFNIILDIVDRGKAYCQKFYQQLIDRTIINKVIKRFFFLDCAKYLISFFDGMYTSQNPYILEDLKPQIIRCNDDSISNRLSNSAIEQDKDIVNYFRQQQFINDSMIHSIPKTIGISVIKPIFERHNYESIEYGIINTTSDIVEKELYKADLDWLRMFKELLTRDRDFVYQNIFSVAEHHCKQLNVNWQIQAPDIWRECFKKSTLRLLSNQEIKNVAAWIEYALFDSICHIRNTVKPEDKTIYRFCKLFQKLPLEKRSCLDENLVDECMKNLSNINTDQDYRILNWSLLWKYIRFVCAYTLSTAETEKLMKIKLQALEDEDLNWALQIIDTQVISKLTRKDQERLFDANYRNWKSLINIIENREIDLISHKINVEYRRKHTFDVYEYLVHEETNKFHTCINLSSFLDNIDDTQNCLDEYIENLNVKDLAFESFKKIADDIFQRGLFQEYINNQVIEYDDRKVKIFHYTRNKIKLSVACWNGGQTIVKHHHPDKYDAIYVILGSLKQTRYENDREETKIISEGDTELLDRGVIHQLSNNCTNSRAISIHVQYYMSEISEGRIEEEYPNSVNCISDLKRRYFAMSIDQPEF